MDELEGRDGAFCSGIVDFSNVRAAGRGSGRRRDDWAIILQKKKK